jgi:hypothetical protein
MSLQSMARETLNNKEKEYSFTSRFDNFITASKLQGCSVEDAIIGMATKHFVSVLDLIEGRLQPTEYLLKEKFGDAYNYVCLLRAYVKNPETKEIDVRINVDFEVEESILYLIQAICPKPFVINRLVLLDRLLQSLEDNYAKLSKKEQGYGRGSSATNFFYVD